MKCDIKCIYLLQNFTCLLLMYDSVGVCIIKPTLAECAMVANLCRIFVTFCFNTFKYLMGFFISLY